MNLSKLQFFEGLGTIALLAASCGRICAASPLTVAAESNGHGTGRHIYIEEYRVDGGGHLLAPEQVEETVYPFLGPYRSATDVEQARAALEQAYRDKGYQTVSVTIPPQTFRGGIVYLKVVQGQIARLRVEGSRYYSLDEIKRQAPSLAEGTVPNFHDVSRDIVGLNQLPDRRVTPSLSPGKLPGTYDVNLNVKDTLPLHGSLEINNRYSADTPELRLNGSINYDNLWQLGHSVGFSFQVAPQDFFSDSSQTTSFLGIPVSQQTSVRVFSGYLGGIGVVGRGQIIGGRAIFALPQRNDFYHSVSLGFDYKHYENDLTVAGVPSSTPVTYYPFSAAYSATWTGKQYEVDFNPSVVYHVRSLGSDDAQFELNRHGASGDFIYFRADTSLRNDLPGGATRRR